MKTTLRFILSLFLLSIVFQASAQSHRYGLSFETSGNRSLSHGNQLLNSNAEAIFGLTGGLGFQFNFNKVFAVKTGVAFEQKGFKAPYWIGSPENTSMLKFQHAYLTVPLLLRATFGSNFRYFVNAGPYVGFALNHRYSFKEPGKTDVNGDENHSFSQKDYGLTFGAGVIYPLNSKLELSLEARNNSGLNNLYIGEYLFRPGEIYKTNSQQLLLGLTYKIGAKN